MNNDKYTQQNKDSKNRRLSFKGRSYWKLVGLFIIVTLALFLLNCTGKEPTDTDKTMPSQPVLIPHLGDTGDLPGDTDEPINDENNGLDAVPDGDWLRIQWKRIDDLKIDRLEIYRFGDYQPEPTLAGSLSRSQIALNEYTDSQLGDLYPIGQLWSYYAELYLTNGNFAVSDTVSYKLLQKPYLLSPANYAQIAPDTLKFKWERTEDALHYRVLVFNSDREYIWHQDYYIIEDSDYTIPYTGPKLTPYLGDLILWRVDSFGDLEDEEGISISGAESKERYIELVGSR